MATRRAPRREPAPVDAEGMALDGIRRAREELETAETNALAVEGLSDECGFVIDNEAFYAFAEIQDEMSEALAWDAAQEVHAALKNAGVTLDPKTLAEVCAAIEDRYVQITGEGRKQIANKLDTAIEYLKDYTRDNAAACLREGVEQDLSAARKKVAGLERSFANTYRRRTAAA